MRNIIYPTNIENKTIDELISNNLKISIEEFKKINLLKIKLHVDSNKYNNKDYLYFCIACVFIIDELNKITDFKNHIKSFHGDFIREFKTNNELKSYTNSGYKKILTCRLVNCYNNILDKIPKKILDIDIILVPLYNKNIKIPFQLGTIKLDNNELTIIDTSNSTGILSFLYNLFSPTCDVYNITYSGNSDDRHSIEFDNDTITYTVAESSKNILNQAKIIKKDIKIHKYSFEYIVYNKIYE
jgi:hypothetical protein